MRVGVCCSARRPVESSTSVELVLRRRGRHRERGAHPPLAVVDDLGEQRLDRRSELAQSCRHRGGWRRAARRGRRAVRRACATRRRTPPRSRASPGRAGRAAPPGRSRLRRAASNPGAMPPRSAWCARLAAQPSERAVVGEHGRDERDVVEVRAAGERVVEDRSGRPAVRTRRVASIAAAHRRRHRPEVHGNVLGLHEQRRRRR